MWCSTRVFFPIKCVHVISEARQAEGQRARWLEPYRSAESQRLCPLIGQECFVVSIDGGLLSDVVFFDFRGRRGRVQQIGGDATRQGRAVQRAEVSLFYIKAHTRTKTLAHTYAYAAAFTCVQICLFMPELSIDETSINRYKDSLFLTCKMWLFAGFQVFCNIIYDKLNISTFWTVDQIDWTKNWRRQLGTFHRPNVKSPDSIYRNSSFIIEI